MTKGIPLSKVKELVVKHRGWMEGPMVYFHNDKDREAFQEDFDFWIAFFTEDRQRGESIN